MNRKCSHKCVEGSVLKKLITNTHDNFSHFRCLRAQG